jgi:hypothetical protein
MDEENITNIIIKELEAINNGINFENFGFVLRPIREDDLLKLCKFYSKEIANIRAGSFVLEDKNVSSPKRIYDFILALKLLKEGNIVFSDIITENTASILPTQLISEEYILYYNEIIKLKELLSNISNCYEILKYRTALLYFDKSYTTVNITSQYDSLIFLMICGEALFLDGRSYSNTGSTIGMGCSMLIGKNNEEREKIKNKFDIAYKIRNIIVHSKDFGSVTNENMKEFYKNIGKENLEIRDYLRKSIIKLIS